MVAAHRAWLLCDLHSPNVAASRTEVAANVAWWMWSVQGALMGKTTMGQKTARR